MHWLDIVLIVWLAASLISGARAGFIYKLGTFVGFIAGVWLSSRWTPEIAPSFGSGPVVTVVVFLVMVSLVSKLFGLAAWIVDKVFKVIAIIPFLKTFNRVLGGLLGVFITMFLISAGVYVADLFSRGGSVSQTIDQSRVARGLGSFSFVYAPFIADSLEQYSGGFVPIEEDQTTPVEAIPDEEQPIEGEENASENDDATDDATDEEPVVVPEELPELLEI